MCQGVTIAHPKVVAALRWAMVNKKHGRWVLTASFVGVAVFAVWAYITWFQPRPGARIPTAAQAVPAVPVVPIQAAEPVPVVPPVLVATSCAFEPLVDRTGARDGQFALSSTAIQRGTDAGPFLKVAEEAVKEGRSRDAEVALIAACRIAGHSGIPTAPLADVKSRLAEHYGLIAARETEVGPRTGLMERAEKLLADSVHAYAGALGKDASRTRVAEKQLAALRERGAQALASAAAPVGVGGTATASEQQAARLGAARPSLAERPPQADEEVVELEADLERLYTQARTVTKDPAGLQRRHQQAMAQRAACRGDESCLRNWHAQRKKQLFAEF